VIGTLQGDGQDDVDYGDEVANLEKKMEEKCNPMELKAKV